MKEEGFGYTQRSMADLAHRLGIGGFGSTGGDDDQGSGVLADLFSSAQFALASLSGEPAEPDPNQDYLASLSTEEQVAWNQTYSRCLVSSSEDNPNPLADQRDWFAVASEEASSRAAGSAEVVEASAEFDRCFSAFGYGDIDDVRGVAYNDVQAIVEDLQAGKISIESARQELEVTATLEAQMSRAFESCDEPYQAVVRRVYAGELQVIAERDSDKAALWANEVGGQVETYLKQLEARR